MSQSSSEMSGKAAALANRLRLVQMDFADDPPETRREHLADEVERVLATINQADREAFLAELEARFPSWDANVEIGGGEKAPVQSKTDDRELKDPGFLLARLIEFAPRMSEETRHKVAEKLKRAGIATQGEAGLPASQAAALGAALQLEPGQSLDAGRALELATMLVEFVSSLDQVVWNTWKAVAPSSAIRRPAGSKQAMAKFAAGDQDVARGQVKQDIERLRQLTAALTASVNQAGRQFAQKHVERFAPAEVEAMAKMSPGAFKSLPVKCWEKYVELAGPMDTASIERELLTAIAAYAESLMKGLAR